MLLTIFSVLVTLWAVGLLSSYTMGGFIHVLLLAAVFVLVVRLVTGKCAA
jgi:hypothetical protein